MTTEALTLFFDGLCPLCAREIAHYRKHIPAGTAHYLDITAADFDARAHGLDPGRVHREMHVKVGEEVRTGVDAFIAIWEATTRYRWAARLARLPGIHFVLTLGYAVFARMRPLLPRLPRPLCESGTCLRS
jgi:predicted DCC family thiol-disulfide oxidoreductase YuxK